jgi:hypothetical protein
MLLLLPHSLLLLLLQVRLAYAGVELDPSKDSTPFKLNPRITMLQCMMRMKGGGLRNTHSTTTATVVSSSSLFDTRLFVSRATTASSTTSSTASSWRRVAAASRKCSAPTFSNTTASKSVPLSPMITAPGAGKGFSAEVQLAKQFRHIMRHPIPGVSVAPDDSDEMTWHVKVTHPVTAVAAC